MIIKFCEYCGEKIATNRETKRFCNPMCQSKHYNQRQEIREKYKLRAREYRKAHPELKEKHNLEEMKHKERRGKYWKEYGIMESLKPFPKDLAGFEIDHIIPLHAFNLENSEEVKKAFSPQNLQWLTIKKNREKSSKIRGEHGSLIKELEISIK